MTRDRAPVLLVAAQGVIGGAERVLLELLSDVPPGDAVVCAPIGSPLSKELSARGYVVRDLSLPKLVHSASRLGYIRSYLRALRSVLAAVRQERATVIHGFAAFTIKLVVPASILTRVPAMVTVHEVTNRRSIGLARSWAQRWLARRYLSLVVAVSSYVADALMASGYPPDRVVVVHNGITRSTPLRSAEEARRDLGLPNDRLLFVLVGRLSRMKGVHIAIEAIELYRHCADVPPALLVIVGGQAWPEDESYHQQLTHLVAARGLAENVLFVGHQRNVDAFYDASDIVLVPSVEPDPFPTVVLEAGLAGRPVIASDCGGAPEAVVEGVTGLVVSPTAVALASAMQRCVDPSWRQAAGAAAQAHVRTHFSAIAFTSATRAQWQDVSRGRDGRAFRRRTGMPRR